MESFDIVILRHIANFLAPRDFFVFRLLANRFNEAVKQSDAEIRCRVQVQTNFTPKLGHPLLGSYPLIQRKIEELQLCDSNHLYQELYHKKDSAELIVTTKGLYGRFIPPKNEKKICELSHFFYSILARYPSTTPLCINNKDIYKTLVKYVSPGTIRNICHENKIFFIYLLKKKKLLKSLYQSSDHKGKPRPLQWHLSSAFERHPEVQHFARKVACIVAWPNKKNYTKLKKIAKKAIPLLEISLTDQERSYLR